MVAGSHGESSVGSRMRIDTMGCILNQEIALLRQHAVESESSNAHVVASTGTGSELRVKGFHN